MILFSKTLRRLVCIAAIILSGSRVAHAQIVATFETTEGNFDVLLDYINAPLAVSNFIQLAGKSDDILTSRLGVPALTALGHDRHIYRSPIGADAPKLGLQVYYLEGGAGLPGRFEIRQNETVIGTVRGELTGLFYEDITGLDLIRLQQIASNPNQYQITIRHPRPWVDNRFQTIRTDAMYRNLPIDEVETGKRFFAGTFTGGAQGGPGYRFQDEVLRVPGNPNNPYGTTFNTGYILAMDSLAPNTNGSRFFVTSDRDPNWNGRYTAFGAVIQNAGRLVVDAIANSSTNGNGVPDTAMRINQITFQRGGQIVFGDGTPGDATFFESFHAAKLPGQITNLPLSFEQTNGGLSLITPWIPRSQNILYQSTDLLTFGSGFSTFQAPSSTGPVSLDLTPILSSFPKSFFKSFSVAMPNWPSADFDLASTELAFKINSGLDEGSLSIIMDQDGMVGIYSLNTQIQDVDDMGNPIIRNTVGNGTVNVAYSSDSGPYQGRLDFSLIQGPLDIDEVVLHFDSTRFANTPGVDESTIIRRFNARKVGSGPPAFNYSGVWQKLQ